MRTDEPTPDPAVSHPSTANPVLSVIIPCRNEELVIEETVGSLSTALRSAGIPHEILCVNNLSTDGTGQLLGELASRIPNVRAYNTAARAGYGVAVRCGIAHATGDAVVIVMADGSERTEDILALYRKVAEGHDCAFGDRFSPQSSVVGYPRMKLLFNRLGNWLIGVMLRSRYRDFTNGFKCYRRHVVDSMQPLISEHFNLTVEMSMSAALMGAEFAIVPNDWRDRDAGKSKFKLMRQSSLYIATISYVLLKYFIGGDGLPRLRPRA